MESTRKMWIVIADGEHARFVSRAPGGGFRSHRVLDSTSAHLRSSDLGDDRPVRGFESATGLRHTITPRQDLHDREKQRFAARLAGEINRESARGAFDRFVLVAPTRTSSVVLDQLDPTTLAKLVGTLRKDLTQVPDHELEAHLDRWADHEGSLGNRGIDALDDVVPGSRHIVSMEGKENP
jgi:protein required for attachment to host cells